MSPPPPMPDAWRRALDATDEGRIWQANLQVDVASGNLPLGVYDALVQALEQASPDDPGSGPFRLSADAAALLLRDAVDVVSGAPDRF